MKTFIFLVGLTLVGLVALVEHAGELCGAACPGREEDAACSTTGQCSKAKGHEGSHVCSKCSHQW